MQECNYTFTLCMKISSVTCLCMQIELYLCPDLKSRTNTIKEINLLDTYSD